MKKRLCIIFIIGMALVGLMLCFNRLNWFFEIEQPSHLVRYDSKEALESMASVRAQNDARRSNTAARRFPRMVGGYVPMNVPTNYVESPPDTNGEIMTVPVIDPKYANPTNWPGDSRPEIKAFYEFAKVAKLYKFDPVVSSSSDSLRYQKMVGTATHWSDIDTRDGRIEKMSSYRDRSASMSDYPGVTDDWANATGQWHERQMVEETFRILRELGYTETLKAVSLGRHEFKPEAWRVKLPEGGFKIVYPFATVKLFGPNISGDPNEPPRVTAQYRMGPDGPVGLVDWYSLY